MADGLAAPVDDDAAPAADHAQRALDGLGAAIVFDLDAVRAASSWQERSLTLAYHSLTAPHLLDLDATCSLDQANDAMAGAMAEARASLVKALPLWVGTLGDIEALLPSEAGAFDVVILDEASQMDQIAASGALLRADRAVIIGDPRQLRFVSSWPTPTSKRPSPQSRARVASRAATSGISVMPDPTTGRATWPPLRWRSPAVRPALGPGRTGPPS